MQNYITDYGTITVQHQPNALGGIKFDSGKVRPTLLIKSMPEALNQVLEVLEKGARKYAPDNWKLVEPERYHDAMLRHIFQYFSGEKLDKETGNSHLAHAVCCALFLMELENSSKELENNSKELLDDAQKPML